jgi:FkbM family methyltransferase
MPFISYAQNLEDVMLWRALKHIEKGFYIDVGAWSPDLDSVTRAFYERGWRGINVEPNSKFHAQLQAHRTRDINLRIAIGDKQGTFVMNFLSNPGLSTLDESIAQRHAHTGLTIDKQNVSVTTLATLCKQHVPEGQEIHILKVDVEGLEGAVLRGNDWSKYRPWIVVVEATMPMSQQESHDAWEPILLAANYRFVYADGLNRFYLANEHAELHAAFKYPPNVFDEFKLGALCQAESRAQQALLEVSAVIKAEGERAKLLESECSATKDMAEKLAEDIAAARDRAIQLEAQLEDRSREIDSKNQALTMELERNKWLLAEWNAAKSKIETQIGEIAVISNKIMQLEVLLTEKSKELQTANQVIVQERERSIRQEDELNAAKIKIDELKVNSHYWWTMADRLIHEQQSMQASVCWRITSPLRAAFDMLLRIQTLFLRIIQYAISYFKRALSLVLADLIRFTLSHNQLKSWSLALLHRSPSIEAWLQRFAAAKGLIAGGTAASIRSENSFEKSTDFLSLSPNARCIYAELKAAIERNNKGPY